MNQFVLDTDMLSLYQRGHPTVCQRIQAHPLIEIAITVITVEEQLSGWYRLLRSARQPPQIASVYQRLAHAIPVLAHFPILPFPEPAIRRVEGLVALKLNIGRMDLRIAAITLEYAAILVTRNTRDFARVPGLVTQDWTI